MFDRPDAGERAVLVHLDIGLPADEDERQEFRQLVESTGATAVGYLTGSRSSPEPRLFVGSGKADELKALVEAEQAELVIFNHALSPGQERNLERHLQCRVIDRTGLILDIFAQRARSFEGKLQVELAQLRHLSTRLVRGWTHLERQKGGIGLRGPGETQLETDRRLLGKRITTLNKRLERIDVQRSQGRRARAKAELQTLSLVGYTNAGKSTLFNRLTESAVYQADQLFATLDPTFRRLELGDGQVAILADTVGFINHLPHDLVVSFRSTLEESRSADLLLHVVDAANPERARRMSDVVDVLTQIGANEVPRLDIFNKIDLSEGELPRVDCDDNGKPVRVWLSAVTGEGIDLLIGVIAELCRGDEVRKQLCFGPAEGRLRAWVFEHARILSDQPNDSGGWEMDVMMSRVDFERFLRQDGVKS